MNKIKDFLNGNKTYTVGIIAILTALTAWAAGEITFMQGLAAIGAAVTAITMRAGIKKSAPK